MWMGPGGIEEGEKLSAAETASMLRRTMRMLRDQRRLVWLATVTTFLWTGTTLAGPGLVKYGIDHGIRARDVSALDLAVGLYVGVAVLAYVVQRAQIILIARVGEGFLQSLRIRTFAHLQQMSMPFYDREKAGVVISRMTSDIDSLAELVQMGIVQFSVSALLLVGTTGYLFVLSWKLSLLLVVTMPPVLLASRKFKNDSNRAYLDIRDRIGSTLSSLQEGIAGVRVVQAFGREPVQIERFAETNQLLLDAHVRSVYVQSWYVPIVEGAGHVTMAGVVAYGGWLVHRGDIQVGTVAAFILLLNQLFEPLAQLSQLLNTLQSAAAALLKIYALLDTPIDVPERQGAVDLPERGEIVVRGVGFSYATGDPVLRDVDLTLAPGERLALVGPTGAGKSTLAKLMARFYDPTDGSVTFGGVDLRDATYASLRERVIVVPQEGFLFNGTLLDNIRLARSAATEDEVWAALVSIGVADRFRGLPDGLSTEVQERGSRFSAGEKQLVSMARAALVDPAVLVLDEATSSLDPGTELLVEHAMEQLMAGRTVIAIAHRLSTAERADRVGVVVDGRLAELGTHDELVAHGGFYTALYGSWAGSAPR